MRPLGEILTLCRDGERPEYEELRYALLAMDHLSAADWNALLRMAENQQLTNAEARGHLAECTARVSGALLRPPKNWIGWVNDPDNEEFQDRRKDSRASQQVH